MKRPVVVASFVCTAVVALPQVAAAQRAAFVQAFSELTAAVEGTYGDEGARIGPALDRMSRALETWDREIAAFESEATTRAPGLSVDKHVALGRMYAERGRFADALRQLDAATSLAAQRADIQALRGLVLDAAGRTREAGEAFRSAWTLDRSDPLAAYYFFRHPASRRGEAQSREAVDALAGGYRRIVKDGAGVKASPFARISLVQETADQAPLIPFAAYRQAYARIAGGDLEGAVADFRTAAASDPIVTDPAVRSSSVMRAVASLRQGRLTEARTAVEQSEALRDSSEARRVLGLIAWVESDYDTSVRQLEAAIRINPRDERSRLALSRVLSSAGRDAEAEAVLEETVRVLPDSARAHLWLASSYERMNQYAEARHAYEAAARDAVTGLSQLYGSIGRLASAAADFPGASEALTRAVMANPNNPVTHSYLASALLQQDRVDEAFAEFVVALLIDPRHAAAHAGIGQIHLDAGRYADAVDALRLATELAPGNAEVQYALASALTRAGNSEEAKQYFSRVEQAQRQTLADRRRALSLDVLKEEAALRTSEGNYERAAALWEQVLTREPGRASNHARFAAVLASAGRIDAAIERYEKALTLGAEPAAYLHLAELYSKAGRAPDAARARLMYEKALQSDPSNGGAGR